MWQKTWVRILGAVRGGVLLRTGAGQRAAAEKTKIVRHKTSGEIDLFSPVNTKEKVNNLGILAVEKLDNLLLL